MKIFLAAGHYPAQAGASFEGFYEHDEAVRWVDRIVALVDVAVDGELFHVVPPGDLKSKANYINARVQPGDLAVEIHFNSAMKDGKHVGSGSVTLYNPGSVRGYALGKVCQAALVTVFQPDRGVVEGWFRGDKTRGAYYFLSRTRCPAVILEPEFVHRKEVIQSRRDDACLALYRALRDYVVELKEDAV